MELFEWALGLLSLMSKAVKTGAREKFLPKLACHAKEAITGRQIVFDEMSIVEM
jgi:hypothetical protein